ncbi:MAG TPA: hypothetical protein VH107_03060, partial [Lacipirellulaceae bacterium]|nr:hypothetical protein [Lacipirellulaceae bacterium]
MWTRNPKRKATSRRRRNGRRATGDVIGYRRRPLYEELEDRRMLAVNFVNVGNMLDSQLVDMQTRLTSGLNNYKTGTQSTIPLVGSSLGTASQIVSRFDGDVKNSLASLGSIAVTDDSISQIQNALSGVPERVGDVVVTRTGSLGSEGFTVEMRLGGTFVPSSTNIGFNTGIPGLPLKVATTGTIDVSVGYAFELAFTFNSNTSTVALDSSKTLNGLAAPDGSHPIVDALNPLAIFITAGLHEGFSARATLGFVDGTAAAIGDQPNGLYLTAMVNNLSGTPTFKLDGGADANLRVTGSFAGTNDDFPAIDVDFHLHWGFSSNNPTIEPQVTYDNVNLNFGQFISNVVRPVFQIIQTTTKPMEPVQEILRYPLPGLSDLSHLIGQGDITLLDLATLVAPYTNYGPLWDLIHSMGDLIYSIDQLNIDSSVKMPLGGFDLNDYDLRTVAPAGDVQDLSVANLTNLIVNHLHASNVPLPSQVNDFSHALSAAETNGYRIDFPIIDDPKQAIFNLLLGRESDLFTFTVDEDVTAQGGQVPSLEVFGMGVEFGGEIPVDAHFKFGYDTLGLRELLNDVASGNTSNVAAEVKDGFYISDDSHFKLSGSLVAGVGVSIGIYSAKIGGFVSTDNGGDDPVSITFEDPNHDGKVRFSEFDTALHTSGRLLGELGIEVGIGVKVLGHFIGVKHRFDIASVVLVDLNMPGPNDPPIITGPILASQPDAQGSIDLYIGAEAAMRHEVDQTDGNERIIIQHVEPPPGSPPPDPNAGETIQISIFQGTFLGTDFWVSQTISGVKSISGYGDLGDLDINVLPEVTSAVHFEGGDGKATLTYSGSGAAYLKAGGEDSELNGGSGSNILVGGPGNDTLVLGSAVNVVGGGAGNNTVVITTPMTQGGLIVGGTDEGDNTFVVLAGEGTQSISATPGSDPGSIDLNYQLAGLPPSPTLALLQFSTFVVSAQDRATNITIGDLSGAGVKQVYVNEPTVAATGRTVDLDARAGSGASNLSLLPFLHIYDPDPNNPLNLVIDNALQFVNSTTGVTTYLFGMAGADQTTVHQHGGTTIV